jgi:hypothetical protein
VAVWIPRKDIGRTEPGGVHDNPGVKVATIFIFTIDAPVYKKARMLTLRKHFQFSQLE